MKNMKCSHFSGGRKRDSRRDSIALYYEPNEFRLLFTYKH